MKVFLSLFFITISLTSIYAQKQVITYFQEGKTKKILKWMDQNPEGIVDILASDIERAVNNFESPSSCLTFEASVLELGIIYKNNEIIEHAFQNKNLTSNVNILSQAFNSAIIIDSLELVKKLIEMGADVHQNCRFCHSRSSLQIALGNGASDAVIELILEQTTDEELLHTDCSDMNTLQFLAAHENSKYLKQLYPKLKEQLMLTDRENNSALSLALFNDHIENARFLYREMMQSPDKDALNAIILGHQNDGFFNLDFFASTSENKAISSFYDSAYTSIFGKNELLFSRYSSWNNIMTSYNEYMNIYDGDFFFPEKVQQAFEFINETLDTDLQLDKNYLKYKSVLSPFEFTFYRDFLSNQYLLEAIKNRSSEEKMAEYIENYAHLFRGIKNYFTPLSITHISYESEEFFEWDGSDYWRNFEIDRLYSEINHVSIHFISDISEISYLKNLFLHADTLALNFDEMAYDERTIELPDYLLSHPVIVLGPGDYIFDSKLKSGKSVTVFASKNATFSDIPEGVKVIKE